MVWRNRISKKAAADVFAAYKAAIRGSHVHGRRLAGAGHGAGSTRIKCTRRAREHDGQVVTISSKCRWCSDALEFTCWNREVVRLASLSTATTARSSAGWPRSAGLANHAISNRHFISKVVNRIPPLTSAIQAKLL